MFIFDVEEWQRFGGHSSLTGNVMIDVIREKLDLDISSATQQLCGLNSATETLEISIISLIKWR